MQKQLTTFFFLSIFTLFLITPISVFFSDTKQHISIMLDISDEESSSKEKENNLETELIYTSKDNFTDPHISNEKHSILYKQIQSQLFIECFSPPPENYLLLS